MSDLFIYVDGGCKDHQDPKKRSAYGSMYVCKKPAPDHEANKVLLKRFSFGKITNNQAEYRILLEALEWCIQEFSARPTIYTDSALVASQLDGTFKTKDVDLKPLKEKAEEIIKLVGAKLEKVPRETIVSVLGH